MLQRTAFLAVLCTCVGTAHGGAKKIRFFTPTTVQEAESVAALGPDADPDGMAILNYAAGADKTIVQIIVSDMTPLLTYSVRLTDGTNEMVVSDAFTTNDEGHGTFHQEFPAADISTYNVELFVGAAGAGLLWSQPPVPGVVPPTPQGVLQPTATVRTAVTPLAFTQLIADDFELGTGETVTKVRWWGGTCGTPELTEFRIQFFDSVGGLPGTVLQTVTTGSLTSVATGETLDCGFPEAAFEADITPSFAPASGSYFVSIAAVDTDANAPNFVWTGASPTGGGAFVGTSTNQTEPIITNPILSEVAFELEETDTTEVRATGTNPG